VTATAAEHVASCLAAAMGYAARGWRVFPLAARAKTPRTAHGCLDATTDAEIIAGWWGRWPDAGVGIATGAASGLVVLDVDPAHGGEESLEELRERYGDLANTPVCLTGGGGTHFYFLHPGGTIRNAAGLGGFAGIDLRGDGGYVCAPPTRHPSGREYAWNVLVHPDDVPPAPMPAWLVELATARRAHSNGAGAAEGREPGATISEGARASELTRIAGAMRRQGATEREILAALGTVNVERCRPPLPEAEVEGIAKSIGRYAPAGEALTDTGNAERLVRLHGEDLLHVHTWGKWLAWDGRRFAIDDNGEIHRRAKSAVRAMYGEATTLKGEDDRKALVKWATKSESASRIEAMIALARAEVPVAHDTLDADPWLLNVSNGTFDLRTGELRAHDRLDLLTKLVPVDYDPDAKAPTWERFLQRILPDAAVRAYVQRAVGYSLSGSTAEQVLFLLWGGGANGKSTFVEALMTLLGDYALRTPAETLLAKRDTGIPNDVARLRGARFVAAVESEEGRRLAEVRVKELTGGDTVSARFMRAEWFDFRPVCKLWLATNHRPQVRGTDDAIWRRIRLIPFTVTIPEPERDHALSERLRAELPGILAWAVRGCLDWQAEGMRSPDAVQAATSGYRAEQDVLGQFLADRCLVDPGCWVASAALFAAYRTWCEATGEHAMTQRALGLALRERGFRDSREGKARTRGWHGIGLLDPEGRRPGGHKADATA
jgi:putative DNA primase/helicase